MAPVLQMPPIHIGAKAFPNVFVFPPARIEDPGKNVLICANLFNFKVDKDATLRDHDLWLALVAAPLLRTHPKAGVRLIGLASRTGAPGHNLKLSVRRARNASISLSLFLAGDNLIHPPAPPPRIVFGGQGEHFAEQLHVPDGTEGPQWRSVLVTILADRAKNTPIRLKLPT
ncbi:MAG: hypothetical protein AB7F89_09765 [Pirellulaceae bacterium]